MYFIGIDLGTSAVKLLLMNEKGKIKKIVSKEYPIEFPQPGWSQQNPEDWWRQSVLGLKELTEDIDQTEVAGISFGGQMHGLVILDEEDRVIRPAILWNDGRTAEETEYLNEVIGKDKLTSYTGNIAFAGFTAPKILWLRNHEPENFERIVRIMLPKDYIAYRFSGVFSTDYSDASGTLLLDVANRRWSEDMLEICGIRKEQMPALYESYEVTGTIRQEVAEELGFSLSCKIIAGAGDNAAAAIGTGTVGENSCNISLGTSGTVFIPSREFQADRFNALHSFAHADGSYHLMGCMLSAASCNQWLMENILQSREFAEEQKKITELGKNHVFFLPYLMGERSPLNDPLARGTFTGITMDTTRTDFLQAVFEGVCFAIRDSYEVAKELGIRVDSSKITGGGARSFLWKRMMANILNLRLDSVESEEGPALGAAILAAAGCGIYSDVKEAAAAIVRVVDSVEPEAELAERYEEQYRKFRLIYPALREVFPQIM